jgi:hypothetical protein
MRDRVVQKPGFQGCAIGFSGRVFGHIGLLSEILVNPPLQENAIASKLKKPGFSQRLTPQWRFSEETRFLGMRDRVVQKPGF